jgi:hypothetical protein
MRTPSLFFPPVTRLPFGPAALGIFSAAVASALLLSWLVSLPTEARTKTYREWMYRMFCTQARTSDF